MIQPLQTHDLTEIISAERVLQSIVNAEYKQLINTINQTHQQDYQGSDKATITINEHSWLNNVAVDSGLRHLVKESKYLDGFTTVLSLFCEAVLLEVLDILLYKYQFVKSFKHGFSIPTREKLLEWFLEASLETQPLFDFSKSKTRHIIIPINIDSHFSVAVIHLSQGKYQKLAHIQYYNSFGSELDGTYQAALKTFFSKRGCIPKYENVSNHEQKDMYNCGIFAIYKAIELASENAGYKISLLPASEIESKDYLRWFFEARTFIASILHQQNINVCLAMN